MEKSETLLSTTVASRLTETQKKRIEKEAKKLKLTKSEFIRTVINKYL